MKSNYKKKKIHQWTTKTRTHTHTHTNAHTVTHTTTPTFEVTAAPHIAFGEEDLRFCLVVQLRVSDDQSSASTDVVHAVHATASLVNHRIDIMELLAHAHATKKKTKKKQGPVKEVVSVQPSHSGLKLYAGDAFISYKKLSHERGSQYSGGRERSE